MSFSYSGDPSFSSHDAVRFLMQDTESPGLLQDEEIAWLLTEEGNTYSAAAEGCRALSRKFAVQPGSRSIGDVSVSYADLTSRYTALAKELDTRSARSSTPSPALTSDGSPAQFRDQSSQWRNNNITGGVDSSFGLRYGDINYEPEVS